ncbi:MAG: creatininase family protein, partial [bacterium]|nr:creatininase family protein [bacterium]
MKKQKQHKNDLAGKISFEDLIVISSLEVGPVRVEKKRLIAPYRIIAEQGEDVINLEYSYEEDVFDPAEITSINLANMIAAQVALNYGLFCREIIFHGIFDKNDRLFIKDMALNTAREIYVKKFLEANPFLVKPFDQLPHIKQKNYLNSKLVFPDVSTETPGNDTAENQPSTVWQVSPIRYCVLSSGGKDSLLSFSLLRELGMETHSIFINESGSHWYTALNAYRFFKINYPETCRVWMNADRVFSRMLHHLPFIRADFSRIRSDDYPIRLWTVAVFLFGALPLLRKRGIGRLVIGDEYDTTRKLNYRGITHYDGLYDQSRYFDNALTRYFIKKGWSVRQLSVLRPLSEMLIQKILVERYPEHQQHQVSCHATHIEGDRVKPCGKCEKCRRIVGMLSALGADPARCGYTPQQITESLHSITIKGLHQEAEGAKHLMYLLIKKGLISPVADAELKQL